MLIEEINKELEELQRIATERCVNLNHTGDNKFKHLTDDEKRRWNELIEKKVNFELGDNFEDKGD